LKAIFADTFYWIAGTSPRDASRSRALAMASELTAYAVSIVTTEEVLTEYLTFLADTAPAARERQPETWSGFSKSRRSASFRNSAEPRVSLSWADPV
jgi:hypothetical protein